MDPRISHFALAVAVAFASACSSNPQRPSKNCVIPTEATHSFIVSGVVEGPPHFAFVVAVAFASACSSNPQKAASSLPKPLTVSP
jgi:hypothetical protein